jgi:hypothetical protein
MRILTLTISMVLLAASGVASAGQSDYNVTIPKVSSYPTTNFSFQSSAVSSDSHAVTPGAVKVKFDNPDWSATVSEANWNPSGAGTFLKLTCSPKSVVCLRATRSLGTYKYVLLPEGAAAPSKNGTYALVWDVRPPGDLVTDVVAVTPEPATLGLMVTGLLVLALFGRKKLRRA